MKLRLIFLSSLVVSLIAAAGIVWAQNASSSPVISSRPVYIPNMSHPQGPLSDATLAWDATMKSTNVPSGSASAHFVFYFTNVAETVDRVLTTNISTVVYRVPQKHAGAPKS